ncbi:MAG: helix-turn-helix transcriptional regulator [Vallitalea sp.]|jgi:predicted transcriptional regulator YheO|nr:helix-turn-helix transcriptional regulator [Vallitalea sp.]
MDANIDLDFLKRLSKAIATHFGKDCEVVIHDLQTDKLQNTILAIENGHVSNRKIGDGASHIVLETLNKKDNLQDSLGYLTKTHDGRIMKSSSIYIRDENEEPVAIFCINYDITQLIIAENSIKNLINHEDKKDEVNKIPSNVNNLLDDLIEQSVNIIGKPVALMTKEDKIKAIQFLNEAGAFLITKSGDKVANYFGISKYSIYNYI